MIEKMEFLSIIGPRDQLDRVTEKYLGKYEIQLENTVGELKNLKNIVPSSESNPYREWIGRAQEAAAIVEGKRLILRFELFQKSLDLKNALNNLVAGQVPAFGWHLIHWFRFIFLWFTP